MTETDWIAADDPSPILDLIYDANFQRKQIDPEVVRKLHLFACGCCRAVWEVLPNAGREAVQQGEACADGTAKKPQVRRARKAAEEAIPNGGTAVNFVLTSALATTLTLLDEDWYEDFDQAHANAAGVLRKILEVLPGQRTHNLSDAERRLVEQPHRRQLAALAREVFGIPANGKRFDRKWRSTQVIDLAQSIYDERAFDRLPALADALEAAGCDDAELLDHCRSAGPHVRGCWAVDGILGRQLDFGAIRKQMAKAEAAHKVSPPLEPTAVWVNIDEPYGLVLVYDEGNRAALEQSALGVMGADLVHDPRADEVRQAGLVQIVDFNPPERDEPFVGQVYVGVPPARDQVLSKSKGRVGTLRAPSGRLRLEGATSLSIGPEEPDQTGVDVTVPPGTYDIGLFIRKSDKVSLLVLTPRN